MNETSNRKRVYLVEDHPLMRASLAALLKQELDLVICGEADNAKRAQREISERRPDLAVLDLSLNDSSGFDLIKGLKAETVTKRNTHGNLSWRGIHSIYVA